MSRDFYEILGVDRDATPDGIRMAYRKKAQKYHPDKATGDEERFKELQKAYETLINEEARAHYDRYGEEAPTVGPEADKLAQLVKIVFLAIQKTDTTYGSPLVTAKALIEAGISKAKKEIEDISFAIEDFGNVLKRLSHKVDGDNSILHQAVQSAIVDHERRKVMMETNLHIGESLLALLAEYDYKVDEYQPSAINTSIPFVLTEDVRRFFTHVRRG